MTNKTALIMATSETSKVNMISQLSATGLFSRIAPIQSTTALFHFLEADSVDLVCWDVEKKHSANNWINRIQADKNWNDLPLIAFAQDQQSLLHGFHLGASDAVHYDIDPRELSARIDKHLQRWQRLLELRHSQEQLQRMALTDPLTKLGNRATFDLSIKQSAARLQRSGAPYSLLLIDLDHFKKINDTHGHQSGDYILQQTAEIIRLASRDTDICCRYGGEEFAVILQDTKGKNAEHLARRIHQYVSEMPSQGHIPLTVSIGISSSNRSNQGIPSKLIKEADQALYLAKDNGRNRTEIWKADFFSPAPRRSTQPVSQLAYGT